MFNSSKGITTGFNNISKRFFAVNEKAIKMRIKSVSSIAKITKAMKMVKKIKLKKIKYYNKQYKISLCLFKIYKF